MCRPSRVHTVLLTPDERRALFLLGLLVLTGQVLTAWREWKAGELDREHSAWLTEVTKFRAARDSLRHAESPANCGEEVNPGPETSPRELARLENAAPDLLGKKLREPATKPAESLPAELSSELPEEITVEALDSLPPGILETGRIRIDEASASDLTQLPGIGPALAARIVAARTEKAFRQPDDLLRVRGIGPKTLDKIRPLITVGP